MKAKAVEFLSIKQLAKLLKRPYSFAYRAVINGRIPSIKDRKTKSTIRRIKVDDAVAAKSKLDRGLTL